MGSKREQRFSQRTLRKRRDQGTQWLQGCLWDTDESFKKAWDMGHEVY